MARPRKNPAPLVVVDELDAGGEAELTGTSLLAAAMTKAEQEGVIDQIVADALGTKKAQNVVCPDCQAEFRAQVPDVVKQVDAVLAFYNRTEGKPGDKPPGQVQIVINRPPFR